MLVNKRIRCMAMERLLSVLGSVDLTSSILLGIYYIDVCTRCPYSQWNFSMQRIVRQNEKRGGGVGLIFFHSLV